MTRKRFSLTFRSLMRRPLIVMMVHDPTADAPRCRLQAEDSEDFGAPIYPETAVAEAIRHGVMRLFLTALALTADAPDDATDPSSPALAAVCMQCSLHFREMTEAHLRQTGATVSAKPIVLRVEFAYCPNLTIIDTPGFILKAGPRRRNLLSSCMAHACSACMQGGRGNVPRTSCAGEARRGGEHAQRHPEYGQGACRAPAQVSPGELAAGKTCLL